MDAMPEKASGSSPRRPSARLMRRLSRRTSHIMVDGNRPIGLTDEEESLLLALKRTSSVASAVDTEPTAAEESVCSCCSEATSSDRAGCPVCLDEGCPLESWPADCGHAFCSTCTSKWLQRSPRCPLCRKAAPGWKQPLDTSQLSTADRFTLMLARYVAGADSQEEREERLRDVLRLVSSSGQEEVRPVRRRFSLIRWAGTAVDDLSAAIFN